MLKISLFLTTILVTSSCGGFKLFEPKKINVDRKIASITLDQILNNEDQAFIDDIDEKLISLHSYYVIGQKGLLEFDRILVDQKLEDVYRSRPYFNLVAVKNQVTEIEKELIEIADTANRKNKEKAQILRTRIETFSKRGALASLSMENISSALNMDSKSYAGAIHISDIAKEFRDLESVREFQVYVKNVEHLSHLLDKKKASHSESNSFRAKDLPPKVWAVIKQQKAEMDQTIRDAGMIWNIDALDWMAQSPDKIIKRTITMMNKTTHDSGVIFIHDTHKRSAIASVAINNQLKKQNRRTCTLTEITKDMAQGPDKVCSKN